MFYGGSNKRNTNPFYRYMTKLFLVRHGQTYFNVEHKIQGQMESDLTPDGIAQATALGKALNKSGITFSALYVSPMRRTRQTSDLCTQGLGLTPIYIDSLKEILMGDWQGLSVNDIKRDYAADWNLFWYHPEKFYRPTCETYLEVRNRAAKAVERIIAEHPRQNVLVITHGALLKTLYTYFRYQSIHEIANAPHPHSTGVCVVEKKNGIWNILDWDNTSHLEK